MRRTGVIRTNRSTAWSTPKAGIRLLDGSYLATSKPKKKAEAKGAYYSTSFCFSLSLSLSCARLPVCHALAGETPIVAALVLVEYYTSGTEFRAAMRRTPSLSASVIQKGLLIFPNTVIALQQLQNLRSGSENGDSTVCIHVVRITLALERSLGGPTTGDSRATPIAEMPSLVAVACRRTVSYSTARCRQSLA